MCAEIFFEKKQKIEEEFDLLKELVIADFPGLTDEEKREVYRMKRGGIIKKISEEDFLKEILSSEKFESSSVKYYKMFLSSLFCEIKNMKKYLKKYKDKGIVDYVVYHLSNMNEVDRRAYDWCNFRKNQQLEDMKKVRNEITHYLLEKDFPENRENATSRVKKVRINISLSSYLEVLTVVLQPELKSCYDETKGMMFHTYFMWCLKNKVKQDEEANRSPKMKDGITGKMEYRYYDLNGNEIGKSKEVDKEQIRKVPVISVLSYEDLDEENVSGRFFISGTYSSPDSRIIDNKDDFLKFFLYMVLRLNDMDLSGFNISKELNDGISSYLNEVEFLFEEKQVNLFKLNKKAKAVFQMGTTYNIIVVTEYEKILQKKIESGEDVNAVHRITEHCVRYNNYIYPLMVLGLVDLLKEGILSDYSTMKKIIEKKLKEGINLEKKQEYILIYSQIVGGYKCRQRIGTYLNMFHDFYKYVKEMWRVMGDEAYNL